MIKIITITLFSLFLFSCGFTPVYQTNNNAPVVSELNTVDIAIIPDEEGVMVRNYLMDRIYKNGYPSDPQYKLITAPINEQIIEIAIDQDDNASRAQLRQFTSFTLIRLSDNKPVLQRQIRATAGYNILDGQFATFVTKENAREQALRTIADKIVIQLELYFARQ